MGSESLWIWIILGTHLAVGVLILTIVIFTKISVKKIHKVSIPLQQITELNTQYSFYKQMESYNQAHHYDNKIYYDSISCHDYLIYQLQFIKKKVINEIQLLSENTKKYNSYSSDLQNITEFGKFDCRSSLYKKYLLKLENKLYEKSKLKPQFSLQVTVNLYCDKINGETYAKKSATFTQDVIIDAIKRLNNRSGAFFNDRQIWDAICRVERGRVTNKIRFSIYARDNYRCRICGRGQRQTELEIDHIKPIAKGGKTTYDNLQTLCQACNKRKGSTYENKRI